MPGPARHTLAHLSDLHLRAAADPLVGGVADARAHLVAALEVLTTWDHACDAWVFTGDLSDDGSPESYRDLRALVTGAADAAGVRVIWATGNHDDRATFRAELLDAEPSGAPYLAAHDLAGLRLLVVDTNVPGVPWGRVADGSLTWLRERLQRPAPAGTLLVLHHAPLPVVQDAAALWPLRDADAVAEVVRGSDVRAILSGHFHQAGYGMFAGVPVAQAPALAYSIDPTAGRTLRGHDAHQGFALVQVYDDTVVHTVVPLGRGAPVTEPVSPTDAARRLAAS